MENPRGQAGNLVYHNVQPSVKWSTQDPQSYVLRIHLPGFKKEDFRVQVDNAGRLTVKGARPLRQGQYERLDLVVELPKQSDIKRIGGKFEDSYLILTLPKLLTELDQRVPPPHEQKQQPTSPQMPEAVAEYPSQREMPKSSEGKAEESMQKKISEEKKQEEQPIQAPQVHEGAGKREEAPIQKEMPQIGEQVESTQGEKPIEVEKTERSTDQKKAEDSMQMARAKIAEEKIVAAAPFKEQEPKDSKKKGELPTREDGNERYKQSSQVIGDDTLLMKKPKRKYVFNWKERLEEMEEWFDYRSVTDALMESINKNKKVIAVAAIAFTVGFSVARKLKPSGR